MGIDYTSVCNCQLGHITPNRHTISTLGYGSLGMMEIPLLMVIASCFFLIEKSAFHLQDPFSNKASDIPVTAIARTIEINTRQLLGETDVPEPVQPNDFYLM